MPTRTTRMAVFPAEQTTRTHFHYCAAYADYATFLGYREFYAARTSSCSHNMPTTQTTRMKLFYVTTRNHAATTPCRPEATRAIL